MQRALEKRPVGREMVDAAVASICHKLRSLGEREIASRGVGDMVMEELRHLDEVAYVRFASVYRSFQDVEAFRTEIDQLRRQSAPRCEQGPIAAVAQRRCAGRGGNDAADRAGCEEHMRRALELAERGLYTTDPNPRVGCVLVRDGAVFGEGWHRRAGEPHAEAEALRAADARPGRHRLRLARAVQPHGPHAAVRRRADRGRSRARGQRRRRPQSARRGQGHGALAGGGNRGRRRRRRRRRVRSTPGSFRASSAAGPCASRWR